jgi:hypothetical protein
MFDRWFSTIKLPPRRVLTLRSMDSVEISLCTDYPADTRKSIPDQEMWPSDFFAPRGGACARLARDVFRAVENSRLSTSHVWLA